MSEICPKCEKEFSTKRGVKTHMGLVHNGNPSVVEVVCDGCGKETKKKKSEINRTEHDFCSKECSEENMSEIVDNGEKDYSINVCKTCGNEFEFYEANYPNGKKYCSRKCLNNRGNKRKSTKCENCDNSFEFYESSSHAGKYCSMDCALDGFSRNSQYVRNNSKTRTREYKQNEDTCESCGTNSNLEVHHIKPVRSNPDLADNKENMILLCYRCHSSVDDYVEEPDDLSTAEKEWRQELFIDKMENVDDMIREIELVEP